MTHEVLIPARGPQMSLLRASPPVLLLATAMALISFSQIARLADAGGKGKGGRQGHIIVQNEVKGNPVPIYMPIPIPIPMPVGPPAHAAHGKPPGGGGHHHPQQHEADGEVHKIYLLQPMPVARPQPHLKGGGLMGVPGVQNNIHLGGLAGPHHQLSAGRHRHGGAQRTTFDAHDQQRPAHDERKHARSASEVKILPIVVIPPIAPMPPVQVASHALASQTPRMTLTPQFNNYVLAPSSHERRRAGGQRAGRHGETFADYGGSVGGSVFRDLYAGGRSRAGRPGRRDLRPAHGDAGDQLGAGGSSSQPRAWRSQGRDYDYGDYDQHGALEERRPRQAASGARRGGGRAGQLEHFRAKSIRDIIESGGGGGGAPDYSNFDEEPGGSEQLELAHGHTQRGGRSWAHSAHWDEPRASSAGLSRPNSSGDMEISMDELALLDRERGISTASSQQHELSSLYYDRGPARDSAGGAADNPLGPGGRASRLRAATPAAASGYSAARPAGERDFLDDEDEWRFDSVKSVAHAAPNATAPAAGPGRQVTSLAS